MNLVGFGEPDNGRRAIDFKDGASKLKEKRELSLPGMKSAALCLVALLCYKRSGPDGNRDERVFVASREGGQKLTSLDRLAEQVKRTTAAQEVTGKRLQELITHLDRIDGRIKRLEDKGN